MPRLLPKPIVRLAVVVVLLALVPVRAFAGAWTREPWSFYLHLGTSFTWADQRYSADGGRAGAGGTEDIRVRMWSPKSGRDTTLTNRSNYQALMTDLYFELGVYKRVTLFGDLPFVQARQANNLADIVYSTHAFGDALLGARFGILDRPFALSIEARVTAPTSSTVRPLPTGSGDWRPELRLAAGKSFDRVPLYLELEVGYTFRGAADIYDFASPDSPKTAHFVSEVVLHGEVGATLLRWRRVDRLMLVVGVDFRSSIRHSPPGDAAYSPAPEDSELTTVSPQLLGYFYKGFGGSLRFVQAVEGKRSAVASTAAGTLFYNY